MFVVFRYAHKQTLKKPAELFNPTGPRTGPCSKDTVYNSKQKSKPGKPRFSAFHRSQAIRTSRYEPAYMFPCFVLGAGDIFRFHTSQRGWNRGMDKWGIPSTIHDLLISVRVPFSSTYSTRTPSSSTIILSITVTSSKKVKSTYLNCIYLL